MSGSYIYIVMERYPNTFCASRDTRVSRSKALSKMVDSNSKCDKRPIDTSAAPNEDWIWVSVVASAVLRRRNTWWGSRRRITPTVPDEGVARNRRRSQTRSLMQRDYYTTRNNVTPDSILPLCLYLELESLISKSSVASGVTKCTRTINYTSSLK